MSLLVWLPLTDGIENQGLSDVKVVNNGASVNNSGKLGKCYYFNRTSNYLRIDSKLITTSQYSISFWMNTAITSATQCVLNCRNENNGSVAVYLIADTGLRIDTGSQASPKNWQTYWLPNTNTWYHVTFVQGDATQYFYIDGVLITSRTNTTDLSTVGSTLVIGAQTVGGSTISTYFGGKLQDVRIYDEALSPKSVKLLSQGLVAHYQLNDPYSTSNLIPNGNGADGAVGWSNSGSSYISTTELPSSDPSIKTSFCNNNTTTSYIPISHGTTYTLSVWLKASVASGTTYPSIVPYDADKKRISFQNCRDGFGASYVTTLAQPLHKGDTVVYATDLSAWTTAANNYNYCAIFGYKDSFGRLYPDMGYTADSPQFAVTGSTKTNIDKTNNTITLNSAFTGEDRPAGTTICQATAGSTYIYPWSSVNVTTIQNWTQKTATINPATTGRLWYAKYINYLAYSNAYHAGITLTDNNSEQVVADSSGYNYYGWANSITTSPKAPRNLCSMNFDGIASYIEFPNLSFMPTMLPDEWTFSFWVYNNDAGSRSILFSNFNLGGVGSNSFGFEKTTGELLRVAYVSGKFDRNIPNSTLTVNAWTHIAVSKTKAHLVSVYRNGVLIDSYTNSNCASSGVLYRMGRDSRTDSTMYRGCLSDFRIYTTVLSADDILALYNTPVSIANNGTMFTQGEFVEG